MQIDGWGSGLVDGWVDGSVSVGDLMETPWGQDAGDNKTETPCGQDGGDTVRVTQWGQDAGDTDEPA